MENNVEIWNAKITNVSLSMEDHGCLTWGLTLDGGGKGCVYGGWVIGTGYLGAKEFKGSAEGIEALMRIMDTVGVEKWEDLKGQYVRVQSTGWGSSITCIGNLIKDKWFDAKDFFETKEKERPAKHIPKNVDELRQFIIDKLNEEYDEIYERTIDTDIVVQVEEENNGRNDVWIQFPYFHSK